MAEETKRILPSETPPAPTRRVEEFVLPGTRRVSEGDESAGGATERLPLGVLAEGTILCEHYRVERTLFSHESQRPGLYLCQGPEGAVIVKVAATLHPPKLDLWRRLPSLNHPHVLHTFRVLEVEGLYYEVQEYCAGGTLAARVPAAGAGIPPFAVQWLNEIFIPQMHDALQYLHGQDIIHRDIKPANIYVVEQEGRERLVLGDFDISSVLEQTRTSRDTQRAAGTWLYTPPEAFPRFVDDHAGGRLGRVTRSCDYYSLGISIIELLLGATSLSLSQLPDLFDFYLQGGRVEIPQGIPGHLSILLRGLLIRNRRTRWGAEQIARWLANASTEADIQLIHDDDYYELARASRPYRIKEHYAVDLAGLADVMAREPAIATEDLITSDILLNWIGNLDPNLAREIRRDRDALYMTPTLVLYRTIYRCDPTRPFIFHDGTEVYEPHEWLQAVGRIVTWDKLTPEAFVTADLLHQLEAWLRLKEHPEPVLADGVSLLHQSPAKIRLEELSYLLDASRPFTIMRGLDARSPAEVVRLTMGTAADWTAKGRPAGYEASYQRWLEGALYAWMRQRGLAELATQAGEVQARLTDEPQAAFETILRILDSALPPVEVVFDTTEKPGIRSVSYGQQRSFILHYQTPGSGIPFGALVLNNAPGVKLSSYAVNGRSGEVEVTIDATHDLVAHLIYQSTIRLESGIARLRPDPLRFSYRVDFPAVITSKRVIIGALIGAVLLGVVRILLYLMGARHPVPWLGITSIRYELTHAPYPFYIYTLALLVLLIVIYIGLKIWFRALRKSEV